VPEAAESVPEPTETTTTATTATVRAEPDAAADPVADPAAGAAGDATGAVAAGTAGDEAKVAGIGRGPGRLLLSLYIVFTVAALSRAIFQIVDDFGRAPLAYLLSLGSGLLYALITVVFWRGGRRARIVALVACTIELLGVLAVGTATVVDRSAFPDQTVWSYFGADYLFLPLVVPVNGLLWLRRAGRGAE
jgi:hypothetical protein